ncbi:hypothetical protein TSOC_003342 [Tetrabaena socialis]|uniref:Uncharacterized protein n=1 Tax=Tetrabaena socialis TaxID=47790 RepID=A0A2J8ABR9_9CHLO|nr:hypothetical protein TSOC_003342 [Tetrabaena socialis]|eukprot:PNH09975.1 hypothetical protein TSOC_003342 [Tetrabaena socialis]
MPSVVDKGPLAHILFEMRTWVRCMLPFTPYVAPFYPTPDTAPGRHCHDRAGRGGATGRGFQSPGHGSPLGASQPDAPRDRLTLTAWRGREAAAGQPPAPSAAADLVAVRRQAAAHSPYLSIRGL